MHDFHWPNGQGVPSGPGVVAPFEGCLTAGWWKAGRVLEVRVQAGVIGGSRAISRDKLVSVAGPAGYG